MITTNYDHEADVLHVRFGPKHAVYDRAVEVAPGVFVEFDGSGNPIGIEVVNASKRAAEATEPASAAVVIPLTDGNVRNSHIYLPLDFFPTDAIGGNNETKRALRQLIIEFEPGPTVETDIDGTKRIFRVRKPVGDFFHKAGIKGGDQVQIVRRSQYEYVVRKSADF